MARVLVTGLGAVSALGLSVEDNLAALRCGRSGIAPKPKGIATALELPVGEVSASRGDFCGMLGLARDSKVTKTALMAALAVREALCDSGADASSAALVLGTSVGGMDISGDFYEEYRKDPSSGDETLMLTHDCGASAEFVAGFLGMKGFTTTVSTACSSAGNAIMLGARMIKSGMADVVVAGGSDALSRFTMNGFNSLRILSSSPCRPFDAMRDGLNLGEGAGFIVLESEKSAASRGKEAYCAVAGWANVNEAFHQTASSDDGEGAFMAMREALRTAGLSASDIDFVNTHGTATVGNDMSEGAALKRIFGGEVPPFNSFKGFTGHTLAASEGIEAVFCALGISGGMILPSAGFSETDPLIGLAPVTEFRSGVRLRNILSNSFGFGGNDSSLIFSAL